MKTNRKTELMWKIIDTMSNHRLDWTKDYFVLDNYTISRLSEYAELFGIQPDKYGRSRSRVLWYRLCDYFDKNLPF